MAMLAEPRRRKRYNLCPRGKALYEDENRFGTKMLEKMGWTKGNGLGAKQDGEKDFVRIRFKNDAEGLGFEARDDQWTTHEEGFNGLLKSLNGEDNEANGKESDPEEENRPMGFGFKVDQPEEPSKKKLKENISGMSLEEKSKQSRARVHYKKFTRGKDLSQYSEKDLANIFGKKATDVVDVPEQLEVEQPKEEKLVDDNFAGVQTVATGLSVSDYFKQKMEAMKNRLKKGVQSTPTMNDNSEEQANGHDEKLAEILAENDLEPSKKKKKKKDKERTVEPTVAQDEIGQSAPKLKKKKSKRSSQDDTEPTEVICVEEKLITSEESNPQKRKKKKDKKEETAEDTSEIIELSVEPTLKKKKSNKKEEVADVIEIIEQIVKPAQKKKSNKSKGTQDFVESVEKNEKPATKKKSNKLHETTEDPLESIENPEEPVPKKKKKSKKPELADSEVIIINDDLSETMYENVSKKKGTKCKDGNQTHVGNDLEIADETSTKKKKKSKEPKRPETEEVESKEIPPPASDIQKTSKKKNKLNKTANAVLESSALATPVSAVNNISGDKCNQSADEDLPVTLLSLEEIHKKLNINNISGDKGDQSADEDLPINLLSLEEIHTKLKTLNTFEISQFCAEKFQMFDMSQFTKSTLSEIVGYGTSENVELKVVANKTDERRILDLWSNKSIETSKNWKHPRYPNKVRPVTIRAVKKRVAFNGI